MNSPMDRMFDPPGPQGLRQARFASTVACVVLAALLGWLLLLFWDNGGLEAKKWVIFTSPAVLKLLGAALVQTLRAAAMAGVLALGFGVLLALLRMSELRWLRALVTGYVEVTRSLPTLLLLYFTILVLPQYGVRLAVYWQLVLALTITNAALISEIVRSSLRSIPAGQMEAAMSLGLSRQRSLLLVVLPQALRAALPPLVAQIIYLLKGTTIGYVISYEELLYNARLIGEYTDFLLQAFIVVTAVYIAVNSALSFLAIWIDRRMARSGITSKSLVSTPPG